MAKKIDDVLSGVEETKERVKTIGSAFLSALVTKDPTPGINTAYRTAYETAYDQAYRTAYEACYNAADLQVPGKGKTHVESELERRAKAALADKTVKDL